MQSHRDPAQVFHAAGAPIEWDEQYVAKEVDPRTNSFVTRENLDSVLVRDRLPAPPIRHLSPTHLSHVSALLVVSVGICQAESWFLARVEAQNRAEGADDHAHRQGLQVAEPDAQEGAPASPIPADYPGMTDVLRAQGGQSYPKFPNYQALAGSCP